MFFPTLEDEERSFLSNDPKIVSSWSLSSSSLNEKISTALFDKFYNLKHNIEQSWYERGKSDRCSTAMHSKGRTGGPYFERLISGGLFFNCTRAHLLIYSSTHLLICSSAHMLIICLSVIRYLKKIFHFKIYNILAEILKIWTKKWLPLWLDIS